jgi:hypothetical protein
MSNILVDDIKKSIYKFLIINENQQFNQFQIYQHTLFELDIDPKSIEKKFKINFIMTIQQLPSTYNDIYVKCNIVNNNKIYTAVYTTDNNVKDNDEIQENNDLPQVSEINQYRYENDDIYYIDPITGNTIFHDVILSEDNKTLDKLLKYTNINYLHENIEKDTPIRYIKYGDQKTVNILLELALKEIKELNIKVKKLEQKNSFNSIFDEIYNKKFVLLVLIIVSFIYYIK